MGLGVGVGVTGRGNLRIEAVCGVGLLEQLAHHDGALLGVGVGLGLGVEVGLGLGVGVGGQAAVGGVGAEVGGAGVRGWGVGGSPRRPRCWRWSCTAR